MLAYSTGVDGLNASSGSLYLSALLAKVSDLFGTVYELSQTKWALSYGIAWLVQIRQKRPVGNMRMRSRFAAEHFHNSRQCVLFLRENNIKYR